jgi:hypothetical protein
MSPGDEQHGVRLAPWTTRVTSVVPSGKTCLTARAAMSLRVDAGIRGSLPTRRAGRAGERVAHDDGGSLEVRVGQGGRRRP